MKGLFLFLSLSILFSAIDCRHHRGNIIILSGGGGGGHGHGGYGHQQISKWLFSIFCSYITQTLRNS